MSNDINTPTNTTRPISTAWSRSKSSSIIRLRCKTSSYFVLSSAKSDGPRCFLPTSINTNPVDHSTITLPFCLASTANIRIYIHLATHYTILQYRTWCPSLFNSSWPKIKTPATPTHKLPRTSADTEDRTNDIYNHVKVKSSLFTSYLNFYASHQSIYSFSWHSV